MTRAPETAIVRWSIAVYEAAIRLFPRDFRCRFGDPLVATFSAVVRDRYARSGWSGVIRLWPRTLADLLRQALPERLGPPAGLGHDLRAAVRTLARSPWATAGLAGTLALGIGATTTMFTLVHGVLLQPLPFEHSERVVRLCEKSEQTAGFCVASAVNVVDLGRASRLLDDAGVARQEAFTAAVEPAPLRIRGAIATPGFFEVLSLRPWIGRSFTDADMRDGANDVATVSQAFWRDHLGSQRDLSDLTLPIDGRVTRIIGVLPDAAYVPGLAGIQLWKPLTASIDDVTVREWRGFLAVARLEPAASRPALGEELSTLYGQLAQAYPVEHDGWRLEVVGLREELTAGHRPLLWLFQGAAGVLLLIAAANVAGLTLVRTLRRRGEFAVRASLGAGRRRLAQQVLVESLLVSLVAGVAGLLAAVWAVETLISLAPPDVPRLDEVSIDATTALFTVATSALTAMAFGLLPAWSASRPDAAGALTGARAVPRQGRLRAFMVTGELSLAFVLLVGAIWLAVDLTRTLHWNPGFERRGLAVSWLLAPTAVRTDAEAAVRSLEQARDAAALVPGVTSAGLASAGPLFGGEETDAVEVVNAGSVVVADQVTARWYDVGPEYFPTLGLAATRGRLLQASDTRGSPAVAVINESFARRVFPGATALGQQVRVAGHTSEIVGVLPDIQPAQPGQSPAAEIYWPIRQFRRLAAYLVVRVEPDAGTAPAAVSDAVAAAVPGLQAGSWRTIDAALDQRLIEPTFSLSLVGAFTAASVGLSLIGVYGVVASLVTGRRQELGVRLALGASPRRLTGDLLRSGGALLAAGLATGVALAIVAERVLGRLLVERTPVDPQAIVVATVTLVAAGIVAIYVPARRASRIDPLSSLRGQ